MGGYYGGGGRGEDVGHRHRPQGSYGGRRGGDSHRRSGGGRCDSGRDPHHSAYRDREDGRRGRSDSRVRRRERSATPAEGARRSSYSRSREKERRRRKLQAECIRRAGGYQMLADAEGKEPVRLFWDGFQWVAKTGHSTALQNDPALMNSTRKMRRLYFGNLPLHLGLTETSFQEIVWEEMRKRSFCSTDTDNPVLCVWFAKDKGNYGFVEFASVEETERALLMDGMLCLGVPLKVSRPNDYTTASAQQSQAMALMGKQSAQMLQMQQQGGDFSSSIPNMPSMANPLPTVVPEPPSRLLRVVEIVKPDGIQEEDEYLEILDDVESGFSAHGKLTSLQIVTPSIKQAHPDNPFGIGDVLIEFETATAAEGCIAQMQGRKYEQRPLQMVRLPAEDFAAHCAVIFNALPSKGRTSCNGKGGGEN